MTEVLDPDRCPLCGSKEFVSGQVSAQGLSFKSDDTGFFARNFTLSTSLRARRCDRCRNVQLFDDA